MKEVCMVFFFTSVGFQANLKVLKSGGKALIVFLGLVIVLIFSQNLLAVGLSKTSAGSIHWWACVQVQSQWWEDMVQPAPLDLFLRILG